MNSKPVRFMNAMVLSTLFFVTVFSLMGSEHGAAPIWSSVHAWAGGLMLSGSAMHLIMHLGWLKNALSGEAKAQSQMARRNLRTDLGLLITGAVCAASGLASLAGPAERIGGLHALSGLFMIVLVGLHLALHWRWMVSTARSLLGFAPAKPAQSLPTR